MATEPNVIYRPEKPSYSDWPSSQHSGGLYLVTKGPDLLYTYVGAYYNIPVILAELVALESKVEFSVWFNGSRSAFVHFDESRGIVDAVQFDSVWSSDAYFVPPADNWPTRDEWQADGGGKIKLKILHCR
jgi:hypothetical protein